MKKRKAAPSVFAIVAAHAELTHSLPNVPRCEDAHESCWACGLRDKRFIEKAHVVPHKRGGSHDPSNYLLLCNLCHREQPDGAPYEAQISWLLSHPSELVALDERWGPVREAMLRMARAAGDADLATRWMDGLGKDGVTELFNAGCDAAARQGMTAELANGRWRFVEAFRTWLEHHHGQG